MEERKLERLLCAWKLVEQEPESTTFYHVRLTGDTHPLYKCLSCDGKTEVCRDYRHLDKRHYA